MNLKGIKLIHTPVDRGLHSNPSETLEDCVNSNMLELVTAG